MAKFVKPLTETQIKNLKPKATHTQTEIIYICLFIQVGQSLSPIFTRTQSPKSELRRKSAIIPI